ncbi:MAG: flagellar hook-associated protein FlgK [Clostridia bacterium]|nr:flagellar hook-associated protein FlgK [Clostridia bacterium]
MRTSFFALNVAERGLYAAQRSLDIVNHNINNVNTPGYSRQMAVQRAAQAMPVYDGTGMIGTGSEVTSISRIRDEYLDFKYWSESTASGEWEVKATQLEDIEKTFNEPSDSGFNKVLDEYFASLQELSKDPSSTAARKLVVGRGVSMAKYFNNVAVHMEKLQTDLNYTVKLKVDEVNSLGVQLKHLNEQIYSSELDGNVANDLRDQRSVIVDKLSKLANIQAEEVTVGKLPNGREDKHYVVTISGKALVDHFELTQLKVVQRENKLNVNEDVEHLYDVAWEDGNTINIRGGELKGYLDIRDGNDGQDQGNGASPLYKGVPFYIKKINDFVRKFALAVNEGIIESTDSSGTKVFTKINSGHADGYGMKKPGSTTNTTGIRFFTMVGWSSANNKYTELESNEFIGGATTVNALGNLYQKMTAKNFSMSADLTHQEMGEYNVAVSGVAGEKEDNSNLMKIMDMRHNIHLFAEGTPEDYMKSVVSSLGIDSQQAIRIFETQEVITKQIENRRSSISGVSLDEEMANLVKFQHAYNASAKMISTIGQIYDILINRLGT